MFSLNTLTPFTSLFIKKKIPLSSLFEELYKTLEIIKALLDMNSAASEKSNQTSKIKSHIFEDNCGADAMLRLISDRESKHMLNRS